MKIDNSPVSATYTPIATSVSNIDSVTVFPWRFIKVGEMVVVSGKIQIDPTVTNTLTEVRFSLPPIPSTVSITDATLNGSGSPITSDIASLQGSLASIYGGASEAILRVAPTATTNLSYSINFSYQV